MCLLSVDYRFEQFLNYVDVGCSAVSGFTLKLQISLNSIIVNSVSKVVIFDSPNETQTFKGYDISVQSQSKKE
jgi:hypothetical protein